MRVSEIFVLSSTRCFLPPNNWQIGLRTPSSMLFWISWLMQSWEIFRRRLYWLGLFKSELRCPSRLRILDNERGHVKVMPPFIELPGLPFCWETRSAASRARCGALTSSSWAALRCRRRVRRKLDAIWGENVCPLLTGENLCFELFFGASLFGSLWMFLSTDFGATRKQYLVVGHFLEPAQNIANGVGILRKSEWCVR